MIISRKKSNESGFCKFQKKILFFVFQLCVFVCTRAYAVNNIHESNQTLQVPMISLNQSEIMIERCTGSIHYMYVSLPPSIPVLSVARSLYRFHSIWNVRRNLFWICEYSIVLSASHWNSPMDFSIIGLHISRLGQRTNSNAWALHWFLSSFVNCAMYTWNMEHRFRTLTILMYKVLAECDIFNRPSDGTYKRYRMKRQDEMTAFYFTGRKVL